MPRKSTKQAIPDEAVESLLNESDTAAPDDTTEQEVDQLSEEAFLTDDSFAASDSTASPEDDIPDGNLSEMLKQMDNEPKTEPGEKNDGTGLSAKPSVTSVTSHKHRDTERILTIKARDGVETEKDREATIWHEIRNAYRTRRILTGMLSGIETLADGTSIAILFYKDMRVIVPLKEMIAKKPRDMKPIEYGEYLLQQNKKLSNMLGAEIDFVVKGIESKTRSIVASRREAMLKKQRLFYLEPDSSGTYRINENRIVQARIIAVSEKVVHFEVFGIECSMFVSNMSWDWISDARERYSVGDQVLVRVLSINRKSPERVSITIDVRSVGDKSRTENLDKCQVQGKYAGKVIDVFYGAVYIRLSNGANAVAHSCLDRKMPGKNDDVSFVITHIDEERVCAVGIITRIIKQNI